MLFKRLFLREAIGIYRIPGMRALSELYEAISLPTVAVPSDPSAKQGGHIARQAVALAKGIPCFSGKRKGILG